MIKCILSLIDYEKHYGKIPLCGYLIFKRFKIMFQRLIIKKDYEIHIKSLQSIKY